MPESNQTWYYSTSPAVSWLFLGKESSAALRIDCIVYIYKQGTHLVAVDKNGKEYTIDTSMGVSDFIQFMKYHTESCAIPCDAEDNE